MSGPRHPGRPGGGRPRAARDPGRAGELVQLDVGQVAHGGHCVARHEGRVVFVRHALPGERVVARLTEAGEGDRFWRADAVEVLEPSAERVEPPCPVARPGLCGGCDWQHASLPEQHRLKAAVVREQMQRLAGLDLPDLRVEPVPGDEGGLGWRTRLRFAVDGQGRAGLRKHRSHEVVPIESCPIAHPEVDAVGVERKHWPRTTAVEVVAALGTGAEGGSQRLVVIEPQETGGRVDVPPLAAPASVARVTPAGLERLRGRTWVEEEVRTGTDGATRRYRVTGTGFWQVHPGAAATLLDAVLTLGDPRPGERVLDLYCGAGLFTAPLAERVGPGGSVTGVEGEARAVADARRNLHDMPWARLVHDRVDARLAGAGAADVVVLDPPRTGAGREVVAAVTALAPRVVVYVACDPAALARDVRYAHDGGYRLAALRAFDLFPMTHHVECVAALVPASG